MRRRYAAAYAVFCTILLAGGFLVAFWFAQRTGVKGTVECICGLAIGFAVSPIVHECGHMFFAKRSDMEIVYAKFFCFKLFSKNGKKRFSFASPFAADETQILPKCGGNMQARAKRYTLGGLVFSGVFLIAVLLAAALCSCFGNAQYLLWGIIPYAGYLFLLNLLPCEYASGKTDMLVYIGLKKDASAEKTMVSAMEIQGELYGGKSFSEIDEALYFDIPQLPEDEPLFAVTLDLRYRYYLEKGENEKAADCLNRLAQAQAYLPDAEVEKLAAELVYMHSIFGDVARAEESGKLCVECLKNGTATSCRILAAFSAACGKTEAVAPLIARAEAALSDERIEGVKKFEKILLSRIAAA